MKTNKQKQHKNKDKEDKNLFQWPKCSGLEAFSKGPEVAERCRCPGEVGDISTQSATERDAIALREHLELKKKVHSNFFPRQTGP